MLTYFTNLYTNMLSYFYDNRYYYLSLKKDKETYTIHGLWPQYSKTSYPKFCKKVNFSIDSLEPIIEELNKKWDSSKESNDEFWKHEYTKHGSCMFIELTELEYFQKTLYLYNYVISNNILDNYDKNLNQILIPFDLNFKLII